MEVFCVKPANFCYAATMKFPYALTLVRLIAPLLILKMPLLGMLLSNFVDAWDWKFFTDMHAVDYSFYQAWDKFLDVFAQLIAVIVVLRWKDTAARLMALFLFTYRLIGVILFFSIQFRPILFFFPNVFDNFFILYSAVVYFFKKKQLLTSRKTTTVVLFGLLIPKLIHEYCMHYLIKQPWELYNVGARLGTSGLNQEYINLFAWGGVLYVLPLLGLLLYCRKTASN